MLFRPDLIREIVRHHKTQTRRPVKAGQLLQEDAESPGVSYVGTLKHTNYRVGQTYAVCPKRGQPGVWWVDCGNKQETLLSHVSRPDTVGKTYWELANTDCFHDTEQPDPARYLTLHGFRPLRIKITKIGQEDVREISTADAIAEGFRSRLEFWSVWLSLYAPPTTYQSILKTQPHQLKDATWQGVENWTYDFLHLSDAARYMAWILTFEIANT